MMHRARSLCHTYSLDSQWTIATPTFCRAPRPVPPPQPHLCPRFSLSDPIPVVRFLARRCKHLPLPSFRLFCEASTGFVFLPSVGLFRLENHGTFVVVFSPSALQTTAEYQPNPGGMYHHTTTVSERYTVVQHADCTQHRMDTAALCKVVQHQRLQR